MPNKQFFLSLENFEKGLIVLYVCDSPVNPAELVIEATVAVVRVKAVRLEGVVQAERLFGRGALVGQRAVGPLHGGAGGVTADQLIVVGRLEESKLVELGVVVAALLLDLEGFRTLAVQDAGARVHAFAAATDVALPVGDRRAFVALPHAVQGRIVAS